MCYLLKEIERKEVGELQPRSRGLSSSSPSGSERET